MPSYVLRIFQRLPSPASPARLVDEVVLGAPEDRAAIQEAQSRCAAIASSADFARLFAADWGVVWCADQPFA